MKNSKKTKLEIFRPLKFTVLTVALISGVMTACSSSRSDVNNSAENAVAQQTTLNSNQANIQTTPTPETAKPADIFAGFKQDEDYKTAIRPKMVKDGWQPARNQDGDDNCAADSEICKEYPELNAGPSSPRGDAIFRWEKADKIVNIYTYDNQLYNRYEFEKAANNAPNISGRYVYKYTEDYGGEAVFSFNDKNTVSYEWAEEDVTWSGNGTWVWNEAKQIVAATIAVRPEVEEDGKSVKPRAGKFVFQKVGSDLKLIEPPAGNDFFRGKIFKKNRKL